MWNVVSLNENESHKSAEAVKINSIANAVICAESNNLSQLTQTRQASNPPNFKMQYKKEKGTHTKLKFTPCVEKLPIH